MQTQTVTVNRIEALRLYRQYRLHQHYQKPIDYEIQRCYHALSRGRLVIRAINSIIAAGVGADGYPKLAIARADATVCNAAYIWREVSGSNNNYGWVFWSGEQTINRYAKTKTFELPLDTLPAPSHTTHRRPRLEAQVPLIPVHLRPKRALENYHILWEAEWRPIPPTDPLLLRRIGQSDLWVVVAQWDLTEVERAALATRM